MEKKKSANASHLALKNALKNIKFYDRLRWIDVNMHAVYDVLSAVMKLSGTGTEG